MTEKANPEASFTIGIDLGTTHCTLSYVDLDLSEGDELAQYVLAVPMVTTPGNIENRPLLPSFLYLPHASELNPSDLTLPWADSPGFTVGPFAREIGSKTPGRLVSSAKSWLCHPGIDRRSPVLPVEAPDDVNKVSPLEASTRYLSHLREAWDQAHPEAPLVEQSVTLTVPASFDPAARELTAEAAKAAGFGPFTLLEEPQAALYSWVEQSRGSWREQVELGDVILVIDLGGGTTDFSLMSVQEEAGELSLSRIAVGDHILLGGDNMDLTLAHIVARKLLAENKKLDAWQMRALTLACRAAKETLLSQAEADDGGEKLSAPIVIPSRGSKLVAGSIRTELTRDEVRKVILGGFFPKVSSSEQPKTRARGALTELGLPYSQDPGVTRHLASFLQRQAGAVEGSENDFARPTRVLFNGGVLKSPLLTERLLGILNGWLAEVGAPAASILDGANLDLACARGAAYYGYAKLRTGVRIRGGTAKSFYVGVEAAVPAVPGLEPPLSAVCVAPFGLEEGSEAETLSKEFGLIVGEPVRFRFFGSSVRRDDEVGTSMERWSEGEMEELEELEATFQSATSKQGEIVPVRLQARVSEVGTLELRALPRDGAEPWKVEFNVRGAG